jgi:surface antigen
MRRIVVALAVVGCLATPGVALAQSATTLGVGSGAVAGALVGGPIGAVAGAVIGGVIGHSSEHRGRRYARHTRRAAIRRAPRRPAVVRVARPAATATAWKDPR